MVTTSAPSATSAATRSVAPPGQLRAARRQQREQAQCADRGPDAAVQGDVQGHGACAREDEKDQRHGGRFEDQR
jgi:hypothetical protein